MCYTDGFHNERGHRPQLRAFVVLVFEWVRNSGRHTTLRTAQRTMALRNTLRATRRAINLPQEIHTANCSRFSCLWITGIDDNATASPGL